jgi:hypothetical protein
VDAPASRTAGRVASAVEHTFYLENGTSRMAAQPALTPAVESNRDTFLSALAAHLLDGAS